MQFPLLTLLAVAGLSSALAVPAVPAIPTLPEVALPTGVLPTGLPVLPTGVPSLDLPKGLPTGLPTLPIDLEDLPKIEKRCSAYNKFFNPCICPSQWGKALGCPFPPGK